MENLSGSWFNPEQNGSGFCIDDHANGIILYWYNYADGFPSLPEDDNTQMWFICQPQDDETRTDFLIYRPIAKWMGENFQIGEPVGALTLMPKGDKLTLEYRFYNLGFCQPVTVSPVWSGCSGKFDIQRLTTPK